MSNAPLSKGYEPQNVEHNWLKFWEEQKTFTPDAESSHEPFSIVIPPPNITGTLHMGHALNLTLQDILCRFKRQQGYNVLWVPGTDHAGIATQNVVERALAKEGISRDELGREKFVDRVWQWKQEYGDKILNQVQRMGASVDWTRLRFTMDDGLSRAVREVFVQLYEQGLIYQGDYIINWCPRCQTALADLEVDHEEADGGLYHLRYPVLGKDQDVVIATTRPETMLGDTAVAVHPEDERYMHLIGQDVELPLVGRKLPVIADPYVDKEFGTGCLKVTPAHDPNDFELGTTHNLEFIKIIDEHGRMTPEAGEKYAGLDRFECRKRLVQDLQEAGYLIKQEPYRHKVGQCYRCHTVIEPAVSKQWFVATSTLARQAKAAVDKGDTRILPANWKNLYDEWLDTIRDWCISRQIWWGHRIPAWTCTQCGELIVAREDPNKCPTCQGSELVQDEDVLDTWFSSALWPFSTLGWPDQTRDLQVFYPTSVLVTGFDIIFFWVARMMMMGLEFMHQVPFRHVYIHALVRDEEGRKMSKSTGNVIDPLDMIENYGADALRFTLAVFAAMGRDIKLSESRIEGYKHFINKIWNAARFALLNLDQDVHPLERDSVSRFSHRFILHELEQTKKQLVWALENYHFNQAAQALYQFVWHTYCDWYLEMIKQELASQDPKIRSQAQSCLVHTLAEILTLLHPFTPFVSQEIWSHLPNREKPNLAAVPFPSLSPESEDNLLSKDMEFLQGVVVSVRNIRSELNIPPSVQLDVLVQASNRAAVFLEEQRDVIVNLARLNTLTVQAEITPPQAVASAVVQGCEVYVPLEGIVDFEAELTRLGKQLAKIDKDMQGLNKKLDNENFVAKAPAEVVDKERSRLQELQEKQGKLAALQERLQQCVV
ncbi:MAG: valine--tRNA ligase [Desulfovermiculus sp.]|nr:valine--tRNA ligase [Desulfovermiculus sp.]